MNINLEQYSGKKICVAVSGGRDSMALLHFMHENAGRFGIELTALNCDHRMRGETSARDSAFVADYCKRAGIPLSLYVADKKFSGEEEARRWRVFGCYAAEAEKCDCIATAHHLDDNAETVLFNLARGTALAGMEGITDTAANSGGRSLCIIHPLIACSRADIDEYVAANGIPYVDDETNFTDDYTRNKIRHNVLPALEEAVPGAAAAIFRFSRLAAEYQSYLERQAEKYIGRPESGGRYIALCEEKVIFRLAAQIIVARDFCRKDYTLNHFESLYRLQFAENGKKFAFLGITAYKESGRIYLEDAPAQTGIAETPFTVLADMQNFEYGGEAAAVCTEGNAPECTRKLRGELPDCALKTLRFDGGKVPRDAVVRFMQSGDRFTKFGGGTKKLGDYMTDKKIPVRLRGRIPLLCRGNEVLMVFGVEISESIKTDKNTERTLFAVAKDYAAL